MKYNIQYLLNNFLIIIYHRLPFNHYNLKLKVDKINTTVNHNATTHFISVFCDVIS